MATAASAGASATAEDKCASISGGGKSQCGAEGCVSDEHSQGLCLAHQNWAEFCFYLGDDIRYALLIFFTHSVVIRSEELVFKVRHALYSAAKSLYSDKLQTDDFLLKYQDGVRVERMTPCEAFLCRLKN